MRYTIPYSIIRTRSSYRVDESTANYEIQVRTTVLTLSSYRLTESGSFRSGDFDISFADSPSTLSRAREGWLVVPNIFFTPSEAAFSIVTKGSSTYQFKFC
jgi:hypothetical protein